MPNVINGVCDRFGAQRPSSTTLSPTPRHHEFNRGSWSAGSLRPWAAREAVARWFGRFHTRTMSSELVVTAIGVPFITTWARHSSSQVSGRMPRMFPDARPDALPFQGGDRIDGQGTAAELRVWLFPCSGFPAGGARCDSKTSLVARQCVEHLNT
jgi:hypothetical protein